MRDRIMIVGRNVALRARLARMLNGGGYRVEIAESVRHARGIDLKGIALAIVATDGLGAEGAALVTELRAAVGSVLLAGTSSSGQDPRSDALDPSDDAGLLRRVAEALAPVSESDAAEPTLTFAGYSLDLAGHSLLDRAGREVVLTPREFSLLRVFVQRSGRVLSRDQLLLALAGRDADSYDRSVDMQIVRLRRKIEPDPKQPSLIVTVPGSGYKFAAKVREAAAGLTEREVPSSSPEPGAPAVVTERRYITALAAQLVAAEGVRLPADPEELLTLIDAYRRYAAAVVARHGGVIANSRGREVLAYFGYPVAEEHAAERAIHAGLALVEHLAEGDAALPAGLAVRAGVASGLVIASPAGEVLGETPDEAARLNAHAEPGHVIVAPSARRLAGGLFGYRDLGYVAVKGVASHMQAWQVLGPSALGSRSEVLHAAAATPLVGREQELDLLLQAWRQATSDEGRLVLLSGEAGIGKSRLLATLEEELADEPHTSLQYFCSPLHQDSALHPIIARWQQEAGFTREDTPGARLRKLESALASANLAPEDIALIAAMLAVPTGERYPQLELSPQKRRERTFAALHRRLVNLTLTGPVLMLFEDAHWADPSSLELLDGLVDQLPELPVLLVVSYRPEFASAWVGRAGTSVIMLSRLSRRQTAALATQVVAQRAMTPALLDRIIAQTDGVPLFIEELTAAVLETSADPSTAALSFAVPATLQASLMARLDRLPAAKQVAQIGAVIGREFPHALLAALPGLTEVQLIQGLDELVASGLASRRGVPPDAIYTFKHALVRDVAYDSLLRGRRTEIHAAIVAAAERNATATIEPAVLGHHCALAGLAAKAADYYHLAGERLAARGASVEARAQFERGLHLAATLPEGADRDQREANLLLAFGNFLLLTKGYANIEAGAVLERAVPVCRRLDTKYALAYALAGSATNLSHRGDIAAEQTIGEDLMRLADTSGEILVNIIAGTVLGTALALQGRFMSARSHFEGVLALVVQESETEPDIRRRSGLHASIVAGFLARTIAILGYPEQARSLLRRSLEQPFHPEANSVAVCRAIGNTILVVLRDVAALRQLIVEQIAYCEKHGYIGLLNDARCTLGWLEARDGLTDQGLEKICAGITLQQDAGIIRGLPRLLALKSEVLGWEGSQWEALAAVGEALEISRRTGESWSDAEFHRQRGELLLTGTEPNTEAAEREFDQAIAIARSQSAKLYELRAATSFARLWVSKGKRAEARDILTPVHSWFSEGFDLVDLKDAKSLLDDLA